MGLDMYLMKTKRYKGVRPKTIVMVESYLDWLDYKSKNTGNTCTLKEWCGVNENQVPRQDVVDFYKDAPMTEVGYWRKANAIHNWFVENVQNGNDDCGYYEVSQSDLEDLRDLCKKVFINSELTDGKIDGGRSLVNGEWQIDYYDGKVIKDPIVAADDICQAEQRVEAAYKRGEFKIDREYPTDVDFKYSQDEVLECIKE